MFDGDRLDARDPELIARLLPVARAFNANYLRLRVRGVENIPSGPALFVSNHNGGIAGPDLSCTLATLWHARGPEATRRYVVAMEGERLVGYAGLAAAGDLGDVQTIAVRREQWGTGLGARLLTELLRAATAFECAEVMLECRVDNVRAQKLYERFGFEPIGFRRGYYQPGNVDALVMRLHDPSSSVQGTETHG